MISNMWFNGTWKINGTSIPLQQVQNWIASATGISEQRKDIGGGNNRLWTVTTPHKERRRTSTKRNIDDFDKLLVKRTTCNFMPQIRRTHLV